MSRLTLTTIKLIGVTLLGVGLVAAYYGPYEIFVFYLFSEGGRFYYDGFGMGSLWFAALVVQVLGYYLIAALLIPVAFGHLKLRHWALTLGRLYAWLWLGFGILLSGNGLYLLTTYLGRDGGQESAASRYLIIVGVFFFLLILLPSMVLWFYRSKRVEQLFEINDPNRYWIDRYPFPLLALLFIYLLMIIVFHVTIFFQGVYPWFGRVLVERQAARMIAFCILVLVFLIYGTVRLKKWAWWLSIFYLFLLTASSLVSFMINTVRDIIQIMDLPAQETVYLEGISTILDFSLLGLITLPLLVALSLAFYSRRYFWNVMEVNTG